MVQWALGKVTAGSDTWSLLPLLLQAIQRHQTTWVLREGWGLALLKALVNKHDMLLEKGQVDYTLMETLDQLVRSLELWDGFQGVKAEVTRVRRLLLPSLKSIQVRGYLV